jgi:hypothetical protein
MNTGGSEAKNFEVRAYPGKAPTGANPIFSYGEVPFRSESVVGQGIPIGVFVKDEFPNQAGITKYVFGLGSYSDAFGVVYEFKFCVRSDGGSEPFLMCPKHNETRVREHRKPPRSHPAPR